MPRTVILRNETKAIIQGLTAVGPQREENLLIGQRVETNALELWRTNGRWSWRDGVDHPLDILKMITPKGHVVAFGQEVLQ